MSVEENTRLVEGIYAEMSKGNLRALSDAMAENVRWVFPGNWSWSGSWESKPVVIHELLRPLVAQFADYRAEADVVAAQADRVVVQARGYGTTHSGEAYHQTYCILYRIADGQITEVVEHCDTALVERLLQPPQRLVG